jgi:predicted transcriptional regulator of viral defense system
MREMIKFKKLGTLLQYPVFRSSDARKIGVSSALLHYYARKGLLDRVQRGIYRGKKSSMNVDFRYEDLIIASKSIPGGVVCLISALSIYDLTDEIPREHWIAVPHNNKAPKRNGVRIIRMRNTDIGKVDMKMGSETIRIFNREKTIIDTFRYLGKEQAVKALKAAYLKKGPNKIDMKKIREYARIFRVDIDPYIIAVTV